jgi:hypothetical protein
METVGNQGIDHEYIVVDPIEKLDVLMHFLIQKTNADYFLQDKSGSE